MNKIELRKQLEAADIRPDAYCLEGGLPNERYVLARKGPRWLVYYSEKGQETGTHEFESESEACEYFLCNILSDTGTRLRESRSTN
jgi:hypothetical protein